MAKNGIGRPSKGERDAFMTKPAAPLGAVIRQRAEEARMTYGEYIAAILARELGMPEYAPQPPRRHEELPIERVA